MRLFAPYQGPELLKQRPVLRNLALAGDVTIELVAELLLRRGHEVDVISQGEVVEQRFESFQPFSERTLRHRIPVRYSSTVPIKFLNGLWSTSATCGLFEKMRRVAPYDLVIIYNVKRPAGHIRGLCDRAPRTAGGLRIRGRRVCRLGGRPVAPRSETLLSDHAADR